MSSKSLGAKLLTIPRAHRCQFGGLALLKEGYAEQFGDTSDPVAAFQFVGSHLDETRRFLANELERFNSYVVRLSPEQC
jgi:hypothetical protein